MSQTLEQAQPNEKETLELSILRLPAAIDATTAPNIMADIERLIQPHSGLMMDFSQTKVLDPEFAYVISFAQDLAQERSATIGSMGENDQVQAVLQFTEFFNRVNRAA
jgi:anti-anti-sigma regulatory factor